MFQYKKNISKSMGNEESLNIIFVRLNSIKILI